MIPRPNRVREGRGPRPLEVQAGKSRDRKGQEPPKLLRKGEAVLESGVKGGLGLFALRGRGRMQSGKVTGARLQLQVLILALLPTGMGLGPIP